MQGALAPFFASGALFGGYLLIKFFPDLNIETFLNAYFWLVGSIAVAGAAASPLRSLVRATTIPRRDTCLRGDIYDLEVKKFVDC